MVVRQRLERVQQNAPGEHHYDRSMPDDEAVRAWIRRNDAARSEDRQRDAERSMAERLEEAVRLSRIASQLEQNMNRERDVRAR